MYIETDTSISKDWFRPADWDKDQFVLRIPLDKVEILHLNLAEWIRQLETLIPGLDMHKYVPSPEGKRVIERQ